MTCFPGPSGSPLTLPRSRPAWWRRALGHLCATATTVKAEAIPSETSLCLEASWMLRVTPLTLKHVVSSPAPGVQHRSKDRDARHCTPSPEHRPRESWAWGQCPSGPVFDHVTTALVLIKSHDSRSPAGARRPRTIPGRPGAHASRSHPHTDRVPQAVSGHSFPSDSRRPDQRGRHRLAHETSGSCRILL